MTTEGVPSLSERLLRAREERGETVEQVHQLIGISPRLIRGLESGHLDVVEPVYVLLALKSYGEHLDLDVDELLQMLEQELNVATKPKPIAVATDSRGGASLMTGGAAKTADALEMIRQLPQSQRLLVVGAAVVAIVFLALWLTSDRGQGPAQSNQLQDEAALAARRPAPADAVEVAASRGSTGTTAGKAPVELASARLTPAVAVDAPVTQEVVEYSAAAETEVAEEVIERQGGDSEPEVSAVTDAPDRADVDRLRTVAVTPASEAALSDSSAVTYARSEEAFSGKVLTLEAEAVDTTWVHVQWDGVDGVMELIPSGQKRRWQAREFFIVKAGRAHGARYHLEGVLLGNGRLGNATETLRFRASKDRVTLLSSDLQPLSQLSMEHDGTASD